jgi:hypothetical protein
LKKIRSAFFVSYSRMNERESSRETVGTSGTVRANGTVRTNGTFRTN